jgi:hypothetical protein
MALDHVWLSQRSDGLAWLEWLSDLGLASWCTLAASVALTLSIATLGCLIVSCFGYANECGGNGMGSSGFCATNELPC